MTASRRHRFFIESLVGALKDESAQGLVEYAIIIAFVATVAVVTLRIFGQRTNNMLAPAQNGFS